MNYKMLFLSLLAGVALVALAASVVVADVIPLRGVIAHERMFFDKHEFSLSGHQGVDMAIVMVMHGQIRYSIGDAPPGAGFTLQAMNSAFLDKNQAALFRGVSLTTDTEVRIIYFGKDRTQAKPGK